MKFKIETEVVTNFCAPESFITFDFLMQFFGSIKEEKEEEAIPETQEDVDDLVSTSFLPYFLLMQMKYIYWFCPKCAK